MAHHATSSAILTVLAYSALFVGCRPIFAYSRLSDASLAAIPPAIDDLDPVDGALLAPLLRPRVPGTPGSAAAQAHFVDFFAALNSSTGPGQNNGGWTLEWQNSTAAVPLSVEVSFVNMVLVRDPPWVTSPLQRGDVSRLTMAAHYDSLYRPEGFIGATDSAAPCAILMAVAKLVDEALTRKWDSMVAGGWKGNDGVEEERGLQILLLDGEEAWESWTAQDSLYGSRALAEAWEGAVHEEGALFGNRLDAISLFMLLDLLGDANPRVPSYFPRTHYAYERLAGVERRLRELGLLETNPAVPFMFDTGADGAARRFGGYVEDDHLPFLQRGVDVLHVIPAPFPKVWHTMDDDGDHVDLQTLGDWAKIVTAFVAEWMDLDGFFEVSDRDATHHKHLFRDEL